MATETLNPNAVGTTNGYSLSAGSGDAAKTALVNDGDDATYAYHSGNFVEAAQKWYIRIDGGYIQAGAGNPGADTGASAGAFTFAINSTNFSGCPTLTKALITSLEIGLYSGTASFINSQTFNLDNPTFPDDATINSVTINGRLSYASTQTRIHEISLVVDYTAEASGYGNDVVGIDSGDISTVSGFATADISEVIGM
jgi:hypothetical protein